MKSDIEIANETILTRIDLVAEDLGINSDDIECYGKHIAKLPLNIIDDEKINKSNLILVTAITPTKSGIGKTTTSIGLHDALCKIGKKSLVALREPSLGPVFGMKGGAAGGGYAQVLPMDKINLHFTGDFHAITSAHNTLAALVDNYDYNNPGVLKEITWKRVLDVNDRCLRQVVTGLGPGTNGGLHNSGFDITPASEIMAILCLATDMDDLRKRLDDITVGYKYDGNAMTVKELGVGGALQVLLLDAIKPNLVQTIEGNPAIIHGGPFANIAHGCNSIIATKMAMSLADYVVTEAGFGADLGAEKFFDIKCRTAHLHPACTVLVCTIGGLKLHGQGNEEYNIRTGFRNVIKHVNNLRKFNQKVVLCLNQFGSDTADEIELVRKLAHISGIPFAINNSFTYGSDGAETLAEVVVEQIENSEPRDLYFAYGLTDTIQEKIDAVVEDIYGGKATYSAAACKKIRALAGLKPSEYPICIAKTQYSFSTDPKLVNDPEGFEVEVKDVVVNTGARMLVIICGDIIRMPGLPKEPAANRIDHVDNKIIGLS